jgi:hypothetical protein
MWEENTCGDGTRVATVTHVGTGALARPGGPGVSGRRILTSLVRPRTSPHCHSERCPFCQSKERSDESLP